MVERIGRPVSRGAWCELDLTRRIESVTADALREGILAPIETRIVRIEESGIRWIVRVVERLAHKPKAVPPGTGRSPWLPPEEALTIGNVGPHHVMVLNKYPVIENHLLLVTRDWVDQEEPLTAHDHAVLWQSLRALPGREGLGFYNGGLVAGASQAHKHLQLVPVPLVPGDDALPINPMADPVPFRHAVERIEGEPSGRSLLATEQRLRERCELQRGQPYNLLLAAEWMLVVPRVREAWERISLNALAFAGCLLVRNTQELHKVLAAGPSRIVRSVTE